jgi:BirA family biotin operon repressor/biotin-[acetyl-CoA-carboxylase] ligase
MNRLFRFNQLSDFIINHEKVSARIIDVNPNGKLVVSIAGDIQAFDFKEIAFVI